MDAWDDEALDDWYASDVASSAEDSAAEQEAASEASEAGEVDDDARLDLLRPPILSICAALGGYEHVDVDGRLELVYRLGDDCLGTLYAHTECLRDLRRLWRQDDTDNSRAVARVFAELGTLHNDLIPILLHTAGMGEKADKIALACTDLITALTWPIDWNAEVHDIVTREEEEDGVLSKLVGLQAAQVQYKASVLRVRAKEQRLVSRTVVGCVMRHLLLPALAKPRVDRTERDTGLIGMCLHLFRNLLAIRDPVAHTTSSAAVVANATLQSLLVEQLEEHFVLDTLLMLASNADTKEYEAWVPVAADCVYQLYIGSDVHEIATVEAATTRASSHALAASLDQEARQKRHGVNNARHSRFGTTIQFRAHDGSLRVARRPAALVESVRRLEQALQTWAAQDLAQAPRDRAWRAAALHGVDERRARRRRVWVLEQQYLKDIHAERERVGDLDAARCKALQLATFFLDYFRARRAHDAAAFGFGLVAAWLEPWAFRLSRSRAAMALEAKQWLEFVAAVRLWTSLLCLLHALAHGSSEERQVADELQNTLYYDGDLLDTSLQVMHAYTAQSFACLEAVLDFAYTMPRLLEKHAAQHEYVFVKARHGGQDDEESVSRSERLFRFQTFQRAMATTRLAHVCTQYLVRWADSAQPRTMLPRLASVVHRITVKAERPALFFAAKTRELWVRLLRGGDQALAACDAEVAATLVKLARYIERQFAKLDGALQEAFDANKRPARAPKADKIPAEICVRPGLEHSEQIGVAVGLLAEEHKLAEVTWVKFHLELASAARKALMALLYTVRRLADPVLTTDSDAVRTEVTRNPALKLLLRLVGLEASVEEAHWVWSVPRSCTPASLDRDARIIDQYLAQPLLIEGELRDQVQRVRAPRARHTRQRDAADDAERPRKRARPDADGRPAKKRAPRIPRWLDNLHRGQ
ncbi:TOF1 [Malassezia furfur]|nr:TOF1 [Malassezia furfur]